MTFKIKWAITAIALVGLCSYTTLNACDNSSLTLTNVTNLGNGEYKIDLDFCVGGGVGGADNSTIDFWFEFYGSGVTLKSDGFPATLSSGQSADGCSTCRTAIAFYNSVGNYQTFANSCPPPTQACPSGENTCVWYSANAPMAPNSNEYFTTLGDPVAPTCPGPPPSGNFFAYTDVYAGSGAEKSYCKSISFTTVGLPDSIRVKGLENTSGFAGYCSGSNMVVFPSCDPFSLDLGDDATVYAGYEAGECVELSGRVSGKSGPFTYFWSTGASSETINVCPTANTSYTLTVTHTATGCQTSDQIQVSVEDVSCGQGNSKKVTLCVDGKAKCVPAQQVQSQLNRGATLGSCR